MNSPGTLEKLAIELANALDSLQTSLTASNVRSFFASMGLDFPASIESAGSVLSAMQTTVGEVADLPPLVAQVIAAIDADDLGQIASTVEDLIKEIKDVIETFDDLESALSTFVASVPGISTGDVQQLIQRLFEYQVITYLENQYPNVLGVLLVLGIAEVTDVAADGPTKPAHTVKRLYPNRLPDLMSSPHTYIRDRYQWGQNGFTGEELLQHIQFLLNGLGITTTYSGGSPASLDIPAADTIGVLQRSTGFNPPGLEFVLGKSLNTSFPPGTKVNFIPPNWFIRLDADANYSTGVTFVLKPGGGLEVQSGTQVAGDFAMSLVMERADGQKAILFGRAGGSRIAAKSLRAGVGAQLSWNSGQNKASGDAFFELEIDKGEVVIDLSGGDSFIASIFPPDGVRFEFDFILGFSGKNGWYFTGGAALETAIPIHKEIFGIELETLFLVLGFDGSQIKPEVSLGVNGKLGPLTLAITRIGTRGILDFDPNSSNDSPFAMTSTKGNLGALDLGIEFKGPNGIGLSLDGNGFKGGGYLYFDDENKRYAGLLELEFSGIVTLKAIGLLTTRMPDGSDGFSLLILITAEFTPIQLGFGFTLIGVGGLFGLNRTMKLDVLRKGIKENSLASVLFPKNVVENADRIISDLRQIFPPQQDRFVFGPMAKIGWGTPTLLSIELGLIIEVPNPVTVAILGIFRAILPDEKAAILKIQVNFLGSIEFGKQLIAFDAGLYDSRILTMTLAGDMALRIGYGDNPAFVLSVGGFHPAFNPPPQPSLPANMSRLTINLLGGNNPRLTLSTYFAITSNTVQFGAKLELFAKAWKFKVVGFLAFDALFQFSPFYFIVSVSAMVAIKAGSATILSIGLSLQLEGPTPWKIKGTGSFKILFVSVKVRITKTFGDKKDTTLPDIEVMPKLVAALQEKNNWQAKLPARNSLLVSLKEISDVDEAYVIAHPSGTLTVSQKIVPLQTSIDKFGSQKPSDAQKFTIDKVSNADTTFSQSDVKEQFAPGEYFEMDNAKKLARKSFEQMPSGVKVSSSSEEIAYSKVVRRVVEYEAIIIDTNYRRNFLRKFRQGFRSFFSLLRGGYAAQSSRSFVNTREPVLGPGKIESKQEGFSIVSTEDLTTVGTAASWGSEAEAFSHMNEMLKDNPGMKGKVQVVSEFELV